MRRLQITPRPDWERKVAEQGFLFYKFDSYYAETTAYEFTAQEIDKIEIATGEIFDMCLKAVEDVIINKRWDEFHIPRQYAEIIINSWYSDACSFYGRLDLAITKDGGIKLLEFNADTPTSLLEASVIQWYWLQEYNSSADQFNSIHEQLINHMKICQPYFNQGKLFFSCIKSSIEDLMTTKYLQDVADQAGIRTDFVNIEDVGVEESLGQFCTAQGEYIPNMFKLYPYEWMFNEKFGKYLLNCDTMWIEPFYKSILSNKMLLVLLYKMFPDSPYILPAKYSSDLNMQYPGKHVIKPVYSREGNNVIIKDGNNIIEQTKGEYGYEGYIYQEFADIVEFDGMRPVIGSWLIGGNPAGMGIRENASLITNNTSKFIPHFFM